MKTTQAQFAELLAAKLGITASEGRRIVDTFKETVYRITGSGHSVELSGFGVFSVSHRAARIGVNPRNPSQRITIPELNTPKFRAGEAWKRAVAIK